MPFQIGENPGAAGKGQNFSFTLYFLERIVAHRDEGLASLETKAILVASILHKPRPPRDLGEHMEDQFLRMRL